MRLHVVVNCGAGSVDEDATGERRVEIEKAFSEADAEVEITFALGSDLADAIDAAAKQQPDAVVVGGGDGSVGTAASVLADGDVPLAVLPLGTFNHFAKDIGMPLELSAAAAAIVHGTVSWVDIAEVQGHCFVNNSSIGVYPTMVAIRDRIQEERGWSKVLAVPPAVWRVLRRFPVRRLTITTEGYDASMRTPFVFIGNNRYDVGVRGIAERTRLDGGELGAYIAHAESSWRLMWIAIKALVRGSSSVPELDEVCVPELTIDSGGHRVLVSLDGEAATLRSPLHYRVRSAALPVLAVWQPGHATGAPTDASGADAEPDGVVS